MTRRLFVLVYGPPLRLLVERWRYHLRAGGAERREGVGGTRLMSRGVRGCCEQSPGRGDERWGARWAVKAKTVRLRVRMNQ